MFSPHGACSLNRSACVVRSPPQTETLRNLKTLMLKKTRLINKFSRINSKHLEASKHSQQAPANLS